MEMKWFNSIWCAVLDRTEIGWHAGFEWIAHQVAPAWIGDDDTFGAAGRSGVQHVVAESRRQIPAGTRIDEHRVAENG